MVPNSPKIGPEFTNLWSRIYLVPNSLGPEFTNWPGPEFTWSRIHQHSYWRGPKLSEGIRGLWVIFVTKTKKSTEKKNTRRFKVNSSSIRQYTFFLEIPSMNWGNPAFFDPLLLLYFPLTSHSIIGSSVSMSVKHKPLHWYCTLLSENPLFSYNSPLLNQKHECYFKSKYPVNMTDEEWLQVLEKKFQILEFFTSPVRAHGRGKGRMHICYCGMFIIGRNLTIFPVWL